MGVRVPKRSKTWWRKVSMDLFQKVKGEGVVSYYFLLVHSKMGGEVVSNDTFSLNHCWGHKYMCKSSNVLMLQTLFLKILLNLFLRSIHDTMMCIRESTMLCLCNKLSLFKTSWQMLEEMPQLSPLAWYLPYLRAFQWGFQFNLSYFWYPVKYKFIQCLIGKLSGMVIMGQED